MRKLIGHLAMVFITLCASIDIVTTVEAAAGMDEVYRLNTGDKIKIHVMREPELSVETRLGSSGTIRYPFLGDIRVSGLTTAELEQKLVRALGNGYLLDPQVRVSMEEFRPFYVNGEVKSPGAYPYQPGLNLRKAISLAGGLNASADENKIFLIKAGTVRKKGVARGLDVSVGPGDTITVKKSYFFVNGEVVKPGKYDYQTDMTFRMAVSIAGGMKERADDGGVYVTHKGKDQHSYHVDNMDGQIKPGDVITIKKSFF